jgi:hypothetical protein
MAGDVGSYLTLRKIAVSIVKRKPAGLNFGTLTFQDVPEESAT